jgi:hypothetical protein
MTTFTMQDLNNIPVTKEEEEAMDTLMKMNALEAVAHVGQTIADNTKLETETPPTPTLETIITNICAQLQLLGTIIKEGQGAGTDVPSLQECVDTTLQQASWFRDMVDERAEELVDDKDFDYQIESAVESYFSNSFSLDDHVDITAEVESKVEDIAEDLLKDIVEERLAEIVSNKLQNLRITFD